MDNASQAVASAKVKRRDRKGGNANRDIDQVEEEDGHWMVLLVHRRLPNERHEFFIAKALLFVELAQFLDEPIAASPEDVPG
jgi:hypothetical protein